MGIFRLRPNQQNSFVEMPEVFPDVHLGRITGMIPDAHDRRKGYPVQLCIVVGCRVVVAFEDTLSSELDNFFNKTWRSAEEDIFARYTRWLESLLEVEAEPVRAERWQFNLAMSFPPPPPGRPLIVPAYPPPPSLPPNLYAHLPFQAATRPNEHFFRFEAWPTSLKLTVGNPGAIAAGTYASPASELPFMTTGFGAVARAALPSYFPAVFRYELKPAPSTQMRCGAVIPNYGQSGGGVEVFFLNGAANVGPIANAAVIQRM